MEQSHYSIKAESISDAFNPLISITIDRSTWTFLRFRSKVIENSPNSH